MYIVSEQWPARKGIPLEEVPHHTDYVCRTIDCDFGSQSAYRSLDLQLAELPCLRLNTEGNKTHEDVITLLYGKRHTPEPY